MRKIFFLCLCVFCLAVSLRPAPAFAATSSAAIANPTQFWNDLLALQQMILAILEPGAGGASGGAALSVYLGMIGAFYNYFMLYIAAPGFVALMLWFFYDYTRRLSKGDANAAMYFIHRALIILLTAILLFPAQEMVGVSDTRPTAVWLVTEGTEAGMELAGLAVKTGYAGVKGIITVAAPSTPNPSILAYAGNYALGIENAGATAQQTSDSALLTQQISTIQTSCGTNDMCYFLSLPYTLEGFIQQDVQNVKAFEKQYHAMLQTNPQAAANEMSLAKAQKKKITAGWLSGVIIGAILTIISLITGVGAIATLPIATATLAMAAGGSTTVRAEIANLPIMFGDVFFFLAFGCAFFFAVLSIMFRTLMYSVLGVMQAFMLPFGKWGTQKIVAYLSNILAFFLSPVLLAFIWFAGLIARELYIMLMKVIPDYLLAASGEVGILLYLITFLSLSCAFILPLCLALTRTSSYLSNIIGGIFQSGISADARFRTLMSK